MRYTQYIGIALALVLAPAVALGGKTTVNVGHGSIEPSSVTIKAGEKVVFRNEKMMPGGHTIVFEELDVQSSGLGKGETWSHTFDEPGTYHFRVKEHPDNTGTVIVE